MSSLCQIPGRSHLGLQQISVEHPAASHQTILGFSADEAVGMVVSQK